MSHATFTGRHRMRPPHVQLRFDLTLENPDDEPRWAILRDELPGEPAPMQAVDLDVYALDGGAVVLHALGQRGLYALLLPPAGRLTLAGLPLGMWSEPPDAVDIEIVLASVLTADGVAPEVGLPLQCRDGARADASRVGDQSTVVGALRGRPAIDWVAESTQTLTVTLA